MNPGKIRRDLWIGLASQIGYKALGFTILAMLARQLSQQDYGKLMFALSLCLLAALLTDLGASQDLVRRVAVRPAGARRRLGLVLSARLPLLATYLLALNVWVALTKPDLWPVAAGIAIYAVCKELHRTFSSLFQGLRRIVDSVWAFGGGLIVLCTGVALGSLLDRGLLWMVGCYVTSGLALVTIGATLARRRVGDVGVRCGARRLRGVFGQSVFLFGLTVMSLVHFSADTLMLGYLESYAEVARYEAAAKLLEASQFLVRPLTLILFPVCAQLATREEWSRLLRLLRRMVLGSRLSVFQLRESQFDAVMALQQHPLVGPHSSIFGWSLWHHPLTRASASLYHSASLPVMTSRLAAQKSKTRTTASEIGSSRDSTSTLSARSPSRRR